MKLDKIDFTRLTKAKLKYLQAHKSQLESSIQTRTRKLKTLERTAKSLETATYKEVDRLDNLFELKDLLKLKWVEHRKQTLYVRTAGTEYLAVGAYFGAAKGRHASWEEGSLYVYKSGYDRVVPVPSRKSGLKAALDWVATGTFNP